MGPVAQARGVKEESDTYFSISLPLRAPTFYEGQEGQEGLT